ncbi:MAG: alpha/beta hydrolase family protein [Bryobacteraceae bacterium]
MRPSAILLLLSFCIAASGAEEFKSASEARKIFAGLLKVPLAEPSVSAVVHSSREEGGLVIEDVSWESQDGETVSAYLIRPANSKGKHPAIICLHGSSGSRESDTAEQFGTGQWTRHGAKEPHSRMLGWARELARKGYITLSITQRGLDSRTPDTNDRAKNLLVRGRTLMGAIVQEIRQGITYLRERPEVRSEAIGISGMSFGGITSFYTWLIDDRIAAAAPICGGIGSVDVLLRNGRPSYHGFYWWIPNMLTKGDQAEFAAAMAPRPLLVWAPREDIGMPKEGVDRFAEVVTPAYVRKNAKGNLEIHQPPGEHSFTLEAFNAMRAFFDKHLGR